MQRKAKGGKLPITNCGDCKSIKIKTPLAAGFDRQSITDAYFVAFAFWASAAAYFRRKRSTRPAVSTSFCLPVKNGWQAEQISSMMSPLWVDRVVKLLPHAQCTRVVSYVG